MPWKETSVRDQRVRFIGFYLTGEHPITDLCRSFGISRKTGYKLINSFNQYGLAGLEINSSAPHNHPNATTQRIEDLVRECKGNHLKWGPKKLKEILKRQDPKTNWPAVSTIGRILRHSGLTTPKKHGFEKGLDLCKNPIDASSSNSAWSADFKGQFTLGNSRWCYPLTMADGFSRMILRCQSLARPDYESVKPVFVAAFREYGLPKAIRTDNGPPFASVGLGGLTLLSIWWIRLGIQVDRIDKGHPEQNARHERMHRELKECAITPPAYDMNSQQRAFDKFRDEYNNIRPHEALGMATPASVYVPSPREYPAILPEIQYPEGMKIRRVRHDGYIRWKGGYTYLSEALANEPVAIDQPDERFSVIYYGSLAVALIDDITHQLATKKQAAQILSQLREEGI